MKKIFVMFGLVILLCINLSGCNSTVESNMVDNYEKNTISEINNLYIKLIDLKSNIKKSKSFKEMKNLLSSEKDLFNKFTNINIKSETEVGKSVEEIRNYDVYKLFESDYVTLKVLDGLEDDGAMFQNILVETYKEMFTVAINSIIEKIPTEYVEEVISETENIESSKPDSTHQESTANKHLEETENYIKNFISLESATVTICEGYSRKEPGIMNVSIKNNGEKNIDELILTVYFQDENGKDIAENSIMLIGGYFGGNTLKANYSWKMEKDEYYALKNLSEEVDISRNRIEISEISFD